MKRWIGLLVLFLGGIVIGIFVFPRKTEKPLERASTCPPSSWQAYQSLIQTARQEKDSLFRVSSTSPIPPEKRKGFKGLRYFPLDSAWHLRGRYEPLVGALAPVIGKLHIDLPVLENCQKPAALLVYGSREGHSYVAFWDSTALQGLTYEGGRYVPVEVQGESACIDFNRAYFPYCAYNPVYICLPYPPQNRLCIAVKAGERW
ncbi:MAG: DUF1684 domain-containing protein [Bacteroidia bacterium]|nr:DUF1684 domain-containing protein [Bacteroidia bacterium]MDW8014901.1 DUF1684 domain-containing protein [Bacteroidia bacterium]